VSLYWLNYRHPDGRHAGVAVIEAGGLIHARMKAALAALDDGLQFASAQELGDDSALQIPGTMIGRLLDHGDLRRLQRMLLKKKSPAPSVRRGKRARRVGKP
jgi:hypothetical protein